MTRRILLTLPIPSTLTLLSCDSPGRVGVLPIDSEKLQDYVDPTYKPGDIWEYDSRPSEESSRLIIVKVQRTSPLGVIIHVGVDKLLWQSCGQRPLPNSIPHMPFARSAISSSVTRRTVTNQKFPDFAEGYQQWRNAFLLGHAGVYTIAVKDAIGIAEKTWRSGAGCDPAPQ